MVLWRSLDPRTLLAVLAPGGREKPAAPEPVPAKAPAVPAKRAVA